MNERRALPHYPGKCQTICNEMDDKSICPKVIQCLLHMHSQLHLHILLPVFIFKYSESISRTPLTITIDGEPFPIFKAMFKRIYCCGCAAGFINTPCPILLKKNLAITRQVIAVYNNSRVFPCSLLQCLPIYLSAGSKAVRRWDVGANVQIHLQIPLRSSAFGITGPPATL